MKMGEIVLPLALITLSYNANAGSSLVVDMDKIRGMERDRHVLIAQPLLTGGVAIQSEDQRYLIIDGDKLKTAIAQADADRDDESLSVLQTLMNEGVAVKAVDRLKIINGTQDVTARN